MSHKRPNHRIARLATLLAMPALAVLVAACGDSSADNADGTAPSNNNNNENENTNGPVGTPVFEYYAESVNYDDSTDTMVVVGLFRPLDALSTCGTLPTSEVRHEVFLGDPTYPDRYWPWENPVEHTPIDATEFDSRVQAIWDENNGSYPPSSVFDTTAHGTVLVRAVQLYSLANIPSGPFVVLCTGIEYLGGDTLIDMAVGLRCGYCGGPYCGDADCDAVTEDISTCEQDCAPQPTCGDGVCEGDEEHYCRLDCGTTDAACDAECVALDPTQYGICNDRSLGASFGDCACFDPGPTCTGAEPHCSRDDGHGDFVVTCDATSQTQRYRGCDQQCWESAGQAGYCDLSGTDNCICHGP